MRPKQLFVSGGALQGGGALATTAVLLFALSGKASLPMVIASGCLGCLKGVLATQWTSQSTIVRFRGASRPVVSIYGGLGALFLAVVLVHWISPVDNVFWTGTVGTGVALLGVFAMTHAGKRKHVLRLEADAEHTVRLPGRYTYLYSRYGRWLLLGSVTFGLLYFSIIWARLGGTTFVWVFFFVHAMAVVPAYNFLRNPEQIVVPEGLIHDSKITEWERFDGFEVTDSFLLIHYSNPKRNAIRFPLADINNPRAVTHTLSRYLRPIGHD